MIYKKNKTISPVHCKIDNSLDAFVFIKNTNLLWSSFSAFSIRKLFAVFESKFILKARVHLKPGGWYYGFNANISFIFQAIKILYNANISFTFSAIKNLYAHLTYLRFGLFCTFFSIFGEKYFF